MSIPRLALGGLLVSLATGVPARRPQRLIAGSTVALTGTVVSANMTASTISVVDVASGETRATFETPAAPHEVAVSHDGRTAIVSIYGDRNAIGNSLMVIDVPSATLMRRIDLGEFRRPHGMAFLPGDQRLAVTSEVARKVVLVDLAHWAVDTTIATDQPGTHMIALAADGRRAFTTNIPAGTVSALDLAAASLTGTFTVGSRIEGIAVAPDGHEAWVGGNDSHTVYIVNTATGAVDGRIEGFGMPYRLGFTPDGRTVVVSDPGAEKIHIVDAATRRVRRVIDVPALEGGGGASPQGVTMARDGTLAFVTSRRPVGWRSSSWGPTGS